MLNIRIDCLGSMNFCKNKPEDEQLAEKLQISAETLTRKIASLQETNQC